jgi:hypothetical protein
MRLTSAPKPIKIRIVSGGEEHSSLDSLLHCFSLPDLQKVDKQLLQWLMRQGEQGNRIANELSRFPNFVSASTVDDYFNIYSAFFYKLIEENDIHSLYQLLALWYGKAEYDKNARFIIKLAFEKDDDITLFCYHHRIEGLTNNWIVVLSKINRPEAIKEFKTLLVQGRKKYFPIVTSPKVWQDWILCLWRGGDTQGGDIKGHIFDVNDVNENQREIHLKYFIRCCRNIPSRNLKRLHEQGGKDWKFYLVDDILSGVAEEDFYSIDRFYYFVRQDYLFCAKLFILLLCDIEVKWNYLRVWKGELVKIYLPAAYMVNGAQCDSLTGDAFLHLSLANQVENFVCKHLFEF